MPRSLSLIGAPTSAGAYAPGQEKAPAAFRRHGLPTALAAADWEVHDSGDIPSFRWRPDPARPMAMNLGPVRTAALAVADRVSEALTGGDVVLVLGGDCTIELGTVAGALRHQPSTAIIYIDLDVDLNIPETSDGALDWTGVAHLLDLDGSAPELSSLGPRRPMLAPADILYFGVANITPPERTILDRLEIETIPLADVQADPAGSAASAVEWGSRYRQLLIHLDMDVLAFTDFPIAENTRRCAGLTLGELAIALSSLVRAANWTALTLTEVNPDHAPDEALAFGQLNAMLASVLSHAR